MKYVMATVGAEVWTENDQSHVMYMLELFVPEP